MDNGDGGGGLRRCQLQRRGGVFFNCEEGGEEGSKVQCPVFPI
jgi:hypothetical protein